jgi:hypothetical protein
MYKIGDRVRTVRPVIAEGIHWSKQVINRRRWNVEGTVCNVRGSRGFICEVTHDDDGLVGFYEPMELVPVTIELGDRVKTRGCEDTATDWTADAYASRRWGVEGLVVKEHNSHGQVFSVQHDDDGSIGFYESKELIKLAPKLDLKGYREQRVLELLQDWIEHERDSKDLLEMAFDAAVDRIKQQYINQYEKLLKALRKEVEHDTPTGEYSGIRALLSDFKVKWETGFDGWQDGAEIEYHCALLEGPHDLRAAGWVVAVHNDYKIGGKRMTFWLLTKEVPGSQFPLCLKGEGASDREALDQIRQHAFAKEEVADGTRSKQIPGEQEGDQSAGVIVRND